MKNKERRVFSRVLSRLAWANVYGIMGENARIYKAVLDAKRWLEGCGFEGVKLAFYEREYHLQFTVYRYRNGLNRYYTVSASHGYVNDYHRTNRDEMRNLIGMAEFSRDCTLSRDFHDYQAFLENAESVLFEVLTPSEFGSYCHNGEVSAIPYDVATRLWRELHSCSEKIANEAVAHSKVVF